MAATAAEGRKKKRWSLGGLFRRRRGGGSSSDDEVGSRDVSGQFVMARASSWANVAERPRQPRQRKSELLPAHTSSDEGSCSITSTSSLNRRSRAARTERYLRRQVPTSGVLQHSTNQSASFAPKQQQQQQQQQQQTKSSGPPTPPERRSSRRLGTPRGGDLETALGELEAIYDSLRYAEEEARPRRSSPRPADDMALRRWTQAPPNGVRDSREVLSQAGSYLLLTPTLSPPPPPVPRPMHEPDTTLDDVVFRSVTQRNNALRVVDPQPPFGIPLGLVSPAPFSDYLHAEPEDTVDGSPNVVLDDLAFRNLRKDRSRSANLNHRNSQDREVNNNLVDSDGKSDQMSDDVPQDLKLAQRMLDIRLNNIRNKIKEQEQEGHAFREPQRARYGADGSRYADLHAAPQRIVIKDEWKSQERKPSKEELRRRFFAEAYKNLDTTAANFKPPPKPPSARHDREHQRPQFYHQGSVDGYRNQPVNGYQFSKSPSPLMEYYPLPGSPKSQHIGSAFQSSSQFKPPTYRSYSAPHNVDVMYMQNRSPASSRHNSPGAMYPQQGSPVSRHRLEPQMCSPTLYQNRPTNFSSSINGDCKPLKQHSPRASRHKSPSIKTMTQEKPFINGANITSRQKSPSLKQQGSPSASRHKTTVPNGSPSAHRRKSPSNGPPTSPIVSRHRFDPNAESFPKMEHQKQNSPLAGRHKTYRQESPGSNRKSTQKQNEKHNSSDKSSTLSSQSSVEHPPAFAFPPKHNSPSSARRQAGYKPATASGNKEKQNWEIKEPLAERPPTIGRDVSLFHSSPTLEELYLMYSTTGNDERVVEGEEGRVSPSGEEVRRIFEAGEESILLKKLEEEAKATSLMVDQQLQRLNAAKTPESKVIQCSTAFTEPRKSKTPDAEEPSEKFALFTIDTRAEILQDDGSDALEGFGKVTKQVVEGEPSFTVTVKSSDDSKSSGIDTPTLTEELKPSEGLKEDPEGSDGRKKASEDEVDRGSRIFNDAVEQINSLSTSECSSYSLERKRREDGGSQEEARNFTGDYEQMRQECDKIGDILNELARDLERTSPRNDDALDKVRDDPGSQVISLAYCMAVAEQLTSVDPLTVLALMFAVASLFLFLYL